MGLQIQNLIPPLKYGVTVNHEIELKIFGI